MPSDAAISSTTPGGYGSVAGILKQRARRRQLLLSGFGLSAGLIGFLALGVGAVGVPPMHVLQALLAQLGLPTVAEVPAHHLLVIDSIRLPRILLGLFVGAALAVSGAVLQALFRNPLADPGLVGVSSGAALAAVSTIVLGGALAPQLFDILDRFALPLSAFLGGLAATALIYRIGQVGGFVDVATMLLAGIAINALSGAGIGMLTYLSDDAQLRALTFWTMGSLGAASWPVILPAMAVMAAACGFLIAVRGRLTLLLLGEREAAHLGVDVDRLKRRAIVAVALSVGAAVSVSGLIGFVGLVVPHLVRLMGGSDCRYVLPGAAFLGGALLVLADSFARVVVLPAELPIGLVTAIIGGPFFLWLLARRRGGAARL